MTLRDGRCRRSCPAVPAEFTDKTLGNGHWQINMLIQPTYVYFAGVNIWERHDPVLGFRNGAEHKLARSDMTGGGRLIMSDIIFGASSDQLYRYNHGNQTWSSNYIPHNPQAFGGANDPGPAPDVSGINKLYTDGSVSWRSAGDMDVEAMGYPPATSYRDSYLQAGVRSFFY